MTGPATQLLTAIPESAACFGCFERIQKFLVAPSREDVRQAGQAKSFIGGRSPSDTSSGDVELKTIQANELTLHLHEKHNAKPRDRGFSELAIVISSMTARPSPLSEPALTDINMQLQLSTITMLTGPVGSGKSTLMRAMLGEATLDSGDIFVSVKDMGYCSQVPWILNVSILQSICGLDRGSTIDEDWYRTVMHASALDQDMLQLADGDQSVPGSRGLTLSGGQKQRVVGWLRMSQPIAIVVESDKSTGSRTGNLCKTRHRTPR